MLAVAELSSRELVMLVMIGLIGVCPSMLLRPAIAWPIRLALMPVIGLCVGTCVTTTLAWFFAASSTFWVLPTLAVASCGIAWMIWRRGRGAASEPAKRTRGMLGLLQCLLVALVVAAPLTLTVLEAHSVGPVSFQVYDAAAYVGVQDGLQHQSIREAEVTTTPNKNLVQNVYSALMDAAQETEMSPLAANMNELLGLQATDTQSAYLIAVMVAGGLGIFAAICIAFGAVSWWAVFGGCLVGGGFMMQLFFDGSEGAICGLVVLLPLGVTSLVAAKERHWRILLVPAILLSGLFALYPEFVGLVGVTVALAFAAATIRSGAIRRRDWRYVTRNLMKIAVVVAMAIAFDVEGFIRAWTIWTHVLHGGFGAVGLPYYRLPVDILPGWLLQMVDFYSFVTPAPLHVSLITALLIPVAILVVLLPSLRRNPFAWLVIPGIVFSIGLASQQATLGSCSYCEDRNLLPLGVILMFLIGLGVVMLARKHPRITLGVAVIAATVMSYSGYNEAVGYAAGTYFLPTSVRSVLNHLPSNHGIVDIEAFDAGTKAPSEFPLTYYMVYEATHGRVSAPADVQGDPGLAYVYVHPLDGSLGEIFNPTYQYVLTRIPGVSTGREVVASTIGVALEKRTEPLDVTVDGGLAVTQSPAENPSGLAEVNGPVRFVVAGMNKTDPSVHFKFQLPSGMAPADLAAVRSAGIVVGNTLSGCAASSTVSGSPAIHTATVIVPPNIGILLKSMHAGSDSCSKSPSS